MFLKHRGVDIDNALFNIEFNKPLNFSTYKDLQLDTERAQLYNAVAAVPHLSNQFKLKKYLGLTEQEIKENEELWRSENGYEKYETQDGKSAELRNLGIRPNDPMAVDPNFEIPAGDIPLEDPTAGEEGINTDDAGGGQPTPPITPGGPGSL